MAAVLLHRIGWVQPFTRFLDDIGSPVEAAFRRARLPFLALDEAKNYVPSERFWAFVADVTQREGITDLGYRVGETYAGSAGDPRLMQALRGAATLHQGLERFTEMVNRTISHTRLGIIRPPHSELAHVFHRPSCDVRHPAIDHIGWYGITVLTSLVRMFAGQAWTPREIGLMTQHMPDSIRESLPHAQVRFGQPYFYIAVEKALLGLPPLNPAIKPDASALELQPASDDLVGSLEQSLLGYVHERDLSLKLATELTHSSARDLQRKLAARGTCYSTVRDKVRFQAASEMLRNPDMKVIDVALSLGYRDPAHFTRAFRRMAGISPRAYRRACHPH